MKKIVFLLFLCSVSFYSLADLFTGKSVTYRQLLDELEKVAQSHEQSAEVRKAFDEIRINNDIRQGDKTFHDFVRVRLAFEATRDSGLWQIRWAITDREPESDVIWEQFRTIKSLKYQSEGSAMPSATAECDELSALFAIIARGLGVKTVGLFWPTNNHTVAVWKTKSTKGKTVRIVVPTSQIFLPRDATLGTKKFDPYKQKNIYNYRRRDIKVTDKIPTSIANMMIEQVKKHGSKSTTELQQRRNRLSEKFKGS